MLTKFILDLKYRQMKNDLTNLNVRIYLPNDFFYLKDMPAQDGVNLLLDACEYIDVYEESGDIHTIYAWDIISYKFSDIIKIKLKNSEIQIYY